MTTQQELLAMAAKARAHSDALIYANTRSQAVDWMAMADLLLGLMATQLEAAAAAIATKG
jgi:hypothetical protein